MAILVLEQWSTSFWFAQDQAIRGLFNWAIFVVVRITDVHTIMV